MDTPNLYPVKLAKSAVNTGIILSLFDYTGTWSKPYRTAGYRVIQVDLKLGIDLLAWNYKAIPEKLVCGILAAPECTHYTVSGAQYWNDKDACGTTEQVNITVRKTLEIINHFKPEFWALENPVGRISKIFPELGKPWYWQPWQFGDPWTKKTGLWGKFNRPDTFSVKPVEWSKQGSWTQLLGGNNEHTKELRSVTPPGFAKAFFKANNPLKY